MTNKKNHTISEVLGAYGIELSFNNSDSTKVSLSASLLDSISTDLSFKQFHSGKKSLIFHGVMLLGYKEFDAVGEPAFDGIRFELKPVSIDNALKIRSVVLKN